MLVNLSDMNVHVFDKNTEYILVIEHFVKLLVLVLVSTFSLWSCSWEREIECYLFPSFVFSKLSVPQSILLLHSLLLPHQLLNDVHCLNRYPPLIMTTQDRGVLLLIGLAIVHHQLIINVSLVSTYIYITVKLKSPFWSYWGLFKKYFDSTVDPPSRGHNRNSLSCKGHPSGSQMFISDISHIDMILLIHSESSCKSCKH